MKCLDAVMDAALVVAGGIVLCACLPLIVVAGWCAKGDVSR